MQLTDTKQKPAETTDLAPTKVGEYVVPKTVEALEQLLAKTRSSTIPLPFRADILPVPVQRLLYSYGGIPTHVPPNFVSILAGRPYVDADGCIDTAIDMGCKVFTEPHVQVLSCLDPESECPGQRVIKGRNNKPDRVIKAVDGDRSYIATATVVKPSGGRFTESAQCCPHTWAGDAAHRPKMAKTRALRRVCKRALAIPSRAVRSDDDPDVIETEFVETPSTDPEGGGTTDAPAETLAPTPEPSDEPVAAAAGGAEAPPPSEASSAETLIVGFLEIERAPDYPHAAATSLEECRDNIQVAAAANLIAQHSMKAEALKPICQFRYGPDVSQITKKTADDLIAYLGDLTPITRNEEEPPF